MKKLVKWTFISLGILLSLLILVGVSFLYFSPQFGGSASELQRKAYAQTGHYEDGVFLNDEKIIMELNCHSITTMLRETMNPDPNVAPGKNIEVLNIAPESLSKLSDAESRITWLGHSSFLIEIEGKKILMDPIFGQYAAPHPWLGRKRFNNEMPITIAELPQIDAVIISHDHYDHLDYPSIKELKDKVDHFFVPLGVANHLKRWKVEEKTISELDWWQEQEYENLKIIMTPSRHMSGRGLTDQSATLWGSWIIQGQDTNIYFSGDGGYGKHFKEIGGKYGPFDVAMMECGQYNELWRQVHMMPEESVMAAIDLEAELIVPIHWGAFALATHGWTDPIERITQAALKMNVPITTPQIGEPVRLGDFVNLPVFRWWENI
ncbi:hypothetical protein GCM10028791_27180 [Echinicola sediminis]